MTLDFRHLWLSLFAVTYLLLLPFGGWLGAGECMKLVEARKFEDAHSVCKLAADHGNARAQFVLALMYQNGEAVPEDDKDAKEEAVKWFKEAAEQGDVDAQWNLALMYENGEGVLEDKVEAVKWFKEAAEQGHVRGQFTLALIYEKGERFKENKTEAVKWYRAAAEQGDADAQFALGRMHQEGKGVVVDLQEAYYWLLLAEYGGHVGNEEDNKLKEKVREHLSSDQIGTATGEAKFRIWVSNLEMWGQDLLSNLEIFILDQGVYGLMVAAVVFFMLLFLISMMLSHFIKANIISRRVAWCAFGAIIFCVLLANSVILFILGLFALSLRMGLNANTTTKQAAWYALTYTITAFLFAKFLHFIGWLPTTDDFLQLAAVLIGPVLAVMVGIVLHNNWTKEERKHHIFSTLMAKRKYHVSHDRVRVLNLIRLEFDGKRGKEVRAASERFIKHMDESRKGADFEKTRNRLYDELLVEMAKVLLEDNKMTIDDIKRFSYAPGSHRDEEELETKWKVDLIRVLRGKRPIKTSVTGIGNQKDAEKYAEEQRRLGEIYRGEGLERDDEKNARDDAEWLMESAAELGNAQAQYALGMMLLEPGKINEHNQIKAVGLFLRAAEQGHSDAQFELGIMYENGYAEGKISLDVSGKKRQEELMEGRVSRGKGKKGQDSSGQKDVSGGAVSRKRGSTTSTGLVIIPNAEEALKWYKLAADQEHADSHRRLALLYLDHGKGVRKDKPKSDEHFESAANLYKKAAEQEDIEARAKAQFELGWMYYFDEIAPEGNKDPKKEAVKLFKAAADQGSARALLVLGGVYEYGEGVPEGMEEEDRLREAVKWYRAAAEQEDFDACAEAQFSLALMYNNDEGALKDMEEEDRLKEAVKWYRAAAEQGHAGAHNNLGLMYQNGKANLEDDKNAEEEAIRLLKEAIKQNRVPEQYNLPLIYAAKLYKVAAKQESDVAQFNLAIMYDKGTGVKKDNTKAVKWFKAAAEQGHVDAQFNLGLMYDNDNRVLKENIEAVKWYRAAAEQGHAGARHCLAERGDIDSQYKLALMYQNGKEAPEGSKDAKEEAVKWYRAAATQGHAGAQFKLALMYQGSEAVPEGNKGAKEETARLYRDAAAQGHAGAQFKLALMYQDGEAVPDGNKGAKEETVRLYRDAAAQGHAGAQFNLALMYQGGEVVPEGNKDAKKEAARLYRAAAEWGDVDAQCRLGLMYEFGEVMPEGNKDAKEEAARLYKAANAQDSARAEYYLEWMNDGDRSEEDREKAIKSCKEAAERRDADAVAQRNLGLMYEFGYGINEDKKEAANLYRKAAEHGDARAQNSLGRMYYFGKVVPEDKEEAAKLFKAAADQGDARGQCNLGVMYELGEGVPEDKVEAVKWDTKAAAQGYARGQCNLGVMYHLGRGVPKDKGEAVKWYRKAAKQGNARGQYYLGTMYENGEGVSLSKADAVKWYRAAADNGHADAQNNLALMYENGEGVEKSEADAVKWYRAAAERGNAYAQNNLGVMYQFGVGVVKNKKEAYIWFWIAVRNENKSGITNKERLARKLTEDEIRDADEEAKRRAEEIDNRTFRH